MFRYQRLLLTGSAACCIAGVASQTVSAPSIDPPVRAALEAGSARVTLELEVAQGQSVAAVQNEVIERLIGTEFELLRRPSSAAFLTLNIGPEALARLETMGDVIRRVYPDASLSPQSLTDASEDP